MTGETNKNRAKGNATKERIYEEAFRLFMNMPYELVTVREIEKGLDVTRGAIFHHVKDKHELFEAVIDKYFLKSQNIYEIIGDDILDKDLTLLEFINVYVSAIEKKINNLYAFAGVNTADNKLTAKSDRFYLSLLLNIGYYLDGYDEKMDNIFRMDTNTWSFYIQKAIERGEVKPNTNVKLFGEIFTSIYLGKGFLGSLSNGIDMKSTKELFMEIYNKIKA